MQTYDVVVIGGGHAGCEASYASAKLGVKTLLITGNKNTIGYTPCNPSIGGPAKGIVVREIDALGGIMAKVTDKSSLQIKMLNLSKGPAVHSLRAQVDKITYPQNMQNIILNMPNLDVKEAMVEELIVKNNQVSGISLSDKSKIFSKTVIVTTGTYMDSYVINGKNKTSSGPDNFKTTKTLSDSLKKYNIDLFKLKTGTPPRIKKNSIDFSKAEIANGDNTKLAFSLYEPEYIKFENQVPCHLIYTNEKTHKIINDNLDKSAMFSGLIQGVGPRYCPSIEDKIIRFSDKPRHQLFLEPESKYLDTIYLQGFSTSMPNNIQDEMIKTLPGLENAIIDKYGYAIEYDAIRPEQLKLSLECKKIDNLYFAGQVNGTSGYEEAAGQGIVAGINAARNVLKKDPLILSRMNSYIGLMIDDLITKGTDEPYRLLTSRSEFRLYLRNDNADLRLSKLGYDIGLLDKKYYDKLIIKEQQIDLCINQLKKQSIGTKLLTEDIASKIGTEPLKHGTTACDLLKRPNMNFNKLKQIIDCDYSDEVLKQAEIQIKYHGYIEKVLVQIKKAKRLYNIKIPLDFNFASINNIALEAREKLEKIKPETLGHAAQISGINPSDINVLEIYIEQNRRNNDKY